MVFVTFPFPLNLVGEGVHFLKFFFRSADSALHVALSSYVLPLKWPNLIILIVFSSLDKTS